MCGIAGILRWIHTDQTGATPDKLIPESWLDALESGIAHRGPDGRGRYRVPVTQNGRLFGHLALVHRRLSILDHGGGRQPMCGPGPLATAVVFNGCIYNHRELRRQLTTHGHRFVSDHSDTEVLVHGTRQWGAELPQHLDGMYGYAAWEPKRGELILARDQAGEKPLYVARPARDIIAFASTVPALLRFLRAAEFSVEIAADALTLWLKHGYWPRLPFELIAEVPPGACAVYTAEGAAERNRSESELPIRGQLVPREHELSIAGAEAGRESELDLVTLRRLLAEAVESRLDADVPIGCFLSGGVDSSVVAALAQEALGSVGRRLGTFSVRMPDPRMDESGHAETVAAHLRTDHATLDCRASAADDLPRLIGQLGLPFGDSSILPTHWVSAAARQHVTVALGGDGGDELFGGYDRYRVNALMYRWRRPLRLTRSIPGWMLRPLGGNLARVAAAARYYGYDDILTIFRTPQLADLLTPEFTHRALSSAYQSRHSMSDGRQDDFAAYLPFDLMRKVDTAAMAVALEVRAPFLERRLVRTALQASLPDVWAGEGRKGLLRKLARRLVPASAVDRRKMGFAAPIGRWFRNDFAGLRTLLHDHLLSSDPFPGVPLPLDLKSVRGMLQEHQSQRRDHSQRLYMLLVLSLWAGALRTSRDGPVQTGTTKDPAQ